MKIKYVTIDHFFMKLYTNETHNAQQSKDYVEKMNEYNKLIYNKTNTARP